MNAHMNNLWQTDTGRWTKLRVISHLSKVGNLGKTISRELSVTLALNIQQCRKWREQIETDWLGYITLTVVRKHRGKQTPTQCYTLAGVSGIAWHQSTCSSIK